jgi:hypothetical protein
MKQILSALAILILSAAAADAQTCAGGTELGRGAHRLSVGGTMTDSGNIGVGQAGAGAAYGFGSNRFFGSVGLGYSSLDGNAGNQTTVNTLFGTQFGGGEGSAFAHCPVGQFDWGIGPNVDDVLSMHTFDVAAGWQVGIPTGDPAQVNLVPTGGFALVRSGIRVASDLVGLSATAWDTYGVANVGLGIRFHNSRMAIVPTVKFPFGRPQGYNEPSVGVMFHSIF